MAKNLVFHLHIVPEDNLVEGDDGGDDLSCGQLALPLLLPHQPPGQNVETESHNLLKTSTPSILAFSLP